MFESNRRLRKRLRLRRYDYASHGAYFVTMCTQRRLHLLDPEPVHTMIRKAWDELGRKFSNVRLDEFVVMPDHIHGIVWLVGADLRVGPQEMGGHIGPPLPRVMQWFKTMTTNEYIRGVKQHRWTQFCGKLWQRNYYERVIRNDRELYETRQYIRHNPVVWEYGAEIKYPW